MSKTVFAFGRMNPPTIGHEKLADKVASEAKRRGAMPHIYLSHTQNAKKDPLPYNVKIAIAKKAFGKAVTTSSAQNIIQIMQELEKMGHTEVTLIAGSDRVPEFKTLLNKYNGKEYNFKKIEVVSAGERDSDAQGVEGMSASKLRGIAQAGDYDTFAQGMPSKLRDSDKKKVYDTIRSVMGVVNEAFELKLERDKRAKLLVLHVKDTKTGNRSEVRGKPGYEVDGYDPKDKLHQVLDKIGKSANMSDLMNGEKVTINPSHPKGKEAIEMAKEITTEEQLLEDLDPTDEELDEILSELDNEEDDLSWEWDEDQLEFELDEARRPMTVAQRQKRKIQMKRLAPVIQRKKKIAMRKKAGGEQLKKRARRAAILVLKKKAAGAKGGDYNKLSPTEKIAIDKMVQKKMGAVGKIAKKLMPQIRKKEAERIKALRSSSKINEEFTKFFEQRVAQDPDVDERPGTQPKKYFSGVRKKSKEARARHFEKGAKMDDNNPAAYKPAPGDAGAKTKPSVHTKKFKQMFGEEVDGKQLVHHGEKTKHFDMCPSALKAFDQNQKDGMSDKPGFHDAVVAVDKYLGFEKATIKKDKATSADLEKMKDLVNIAKEKIEDAGLKGHTYHQIHIDAVQRHMKDVNEAFERIMTGLNEAVEYLEEKQIDALKKKSEKTGIPYGILKQVYNRGMAAWRTGHRPGTTPQQWAFARVNSFATKSKGTWGGADKDLAAKARGSMKKEEVNETNPCWDGFRQVGMKKGAGDKMAPNCVPEEVELDEISSKKLADYMNKASDARGHKNLSLKKKDNRYVGVAKASKKLDSRKEGVEVEENFQDGKNPGRKGLSQRVGIPKNATMAELEKAAKADGEKGRLARWQINMRRGKKEEIELEEGDILQSPRDGIRLIVRKHTDGKRYVLKMMTQNKPGEPKILSKKDAEKQISALKRMGWKKATNEEGGAGEEGTYELVRKYKKDTPGEVNEAFEMAMQRQGGYEHHPDVEAALEEEPCCDDCLDEDYGWTEETDLVAINEAEAEYQGRKVKLNNPTRSDNPKKKTMVYVKNDKGNVVKVYFGDPNLSIKRDDPERRKAFRSRHNCDNPGPKWKPRYWSCKFWSTKSVSDLMKG